MFVMKETHCIVTPVSHLFQSSGGLIFLNFELRIISARASSNDKSQRRGSSATRNHNKNKEQKKKKETKNEEPSIVLFLFD